MKKLEKILPKDIVTLVDDEFNTLFKKAEADGKSLVTLKEKELN